MTVDFAVAEMYVSKIRMMLFAVLKSIDIDNFDNFQCICEETLYYTSNCIEYIN